MSGDHAHPIAVSAAGRYKRPLVIAFVLTAVYTVVEVGVGFGVGSLALISDAGYMLTDVPGEESAAVLQRATTLLVEDVGIEHVTLQLEPADMSPHEPMRV
jgi:Co/Zn/Cd efflux system component